MRSEVASGGEKEEWTQKRLSGKRAGRAPRASRRDTYVLSPCRSVPSSHRTLFARDARAHVCNSRRASGVRRTSALLTLPGLCKKCRLGAVPITQCALCCFAPPDERTSSRWEKTSVMAVNPRHGEPRAASASSLVARSGQSRGRRRVALLPGRAAVNGREPNGRGFREALSRSYHRVPPGPLVPLRERRSHNEYSLTV